MNNVCEKLFSVDDMMYVMVIDNREFVDISVLGSWLKKYMELKLLEMMIYCFGDYLVVLFCNFKWNVDCVLCWFCLSWDM